MKKRIILLVIIILGISALQWKKATFESRRKAYHTEKKIHQESVIKQKRISDHMFYISTPIGSVGIL